MMMGGSKGIIEAVQKAGGDVGPRVYWVGAWVLKSGWGGLESFYAWCKTNNHQPMVHLWTFGDGLNDKDRTLDDILVNGVDDPHQGVRMHWALAREMAVKVASLAKAAGVVPIVTVESEFTKKGAESSVKMRHFLWDMATTLKKELPDIKLVFAPGLWADAKAIGTWYKDVAQFMDYIGVQCVKFQPYHGDYTGSAADIISKLKTYRSVIGNKPTVVHDTFLSTYAGGDKTHPYAGGDPSAYDEKQAQTIASMAKLAEAGIDLEFFIYRDLRDNPKFAITNFGGYAERHAGVIRADGTPKPGHKALLGLAMPPKPEPVPEPVPDPEPEPADSTLEQLELRVKVIEDTIAAHDKLLKDMTGLVSSLNDSVQEAVSALRGRQEDLSDRLNRAAAAMQGEIG